MAILHFSSQYKNVAVITPRLVQRHASCLFVLLTMPMSGSSKGQLLHKAR